MQHLENVIARSPAMVRRPEEAVRNGDDMAIPVTGKIAWNNKKQDNATD